MQLAVDYGNELGSIVSVAGSYGGRTAPQPLSGIERQMLDLGMAAAADSLPSSQAAPLMFADGLADTGSAAHLGACSRPASPRANSWLQTAPRFP